MAILIFLHIIYIIKLIKDISSLLEKLNNDLTKKMKKIKNDKEIQTYINNKIQLVLKLIELKEKCFVKYFSLYINIIKDENINDLLLKCYIISKCIIDFIYNNDYFTEQDVYSIFNFIYGIHNNNDYKILFFRFMDIFDDDMSSKNSKYYNFGKRLINNLKNNKIFLKIIIILLYKNMNYSLSYLEEKFCEYKFEPKTNTNTNKINLNNQNIQNNNNQIIIVNNNDHFNINNYNNSNNILFGIGGIQEEQSNRNDGRINPDPMTDKKKLVLLKNSLEDANQQLITYLKLFFII